MSDPVQDWVDAVRTVGGRAAPARRCGRDLCDRYGEPHRRYHDLDHVRAVLRDGETLAAELRLDPQQRAVLTLAVCAHDVVYDARPGADEQASADWVRGALAATGVTDAVIDRVAALVLGTASHEADPQDPVEAALSDADLAILAADTATYDRYVTGVRQEFAAVTDEQWRTGREAVLRSLADRPRLYVTDAGHRRWDAAARANLARERQRLVSATPRCSSGPSVPH